MTAVLVLDLSNNNRGEVTSLQFFVEARAAGYKAVILKASEGAGFADPYFVQWALWGHAAGLYVGAYHFGHADQSVAAQVNLFLTRVAAAAAAGCPIAFKVLDQEVAGGNIEAFAQAFCPATVTRLLYAGASYAAANLTQPIPGVLWWLAAYGQPRPPTPPWGTEAGWQFTDHATIPGAAGSFDESMFDPTVWAALVGSLPTPGDISVAMSCTDPVTHGAWSVTPDGAVFSDGSPHPAPYLGGLNNHPEYHAGGSTDPATGIEVNPADNGYRIFTFDGHTTGFYDFPRNGTLAK